MQKILDNTLPYQSKWNIFFYLNLILYYTKSKTFKHVYCCSNTHQSFILTKQSHRNKNNSCLLSKLPNSPLSTDLLPNHEKNAYNFITYTTNDAKILQSDTRERTKIKKKLYTFKHSSYRHSIKKQMWQITATQNVWSH